MTLEGVDVGLILVALGIGFIFGALFEMRRSPKWNKVTDNGVERIYYKSWDGVNWVEVHREKRNK